MTSSFRYPSGEEHEVAPVLTFVLSPLCSARSTGYSPTRPRRWPSACPRIEMSPKIDVIKNMRRISRSLPNFPAWRRRTLKSNLWTMS